MKLAHQVVKTPQSDTDAATKGYVNSMTTAGDTIFRWNRADVDQFILVDPLAQGWSTTFVAASGAVPEHIKLTAPGSWSNATGPVFLLVNPDLASSDHDIVVTHDLLSPTQYAQEVGIVDRYVGSQDFVASLWDSTPGEVPSIRVEATVGGVPSTVYTSPEVLPQGIIMGADTILRTNSAAIRGLHGCGWGRIAGHGFCNGPEVLQTDRTVGFAVLSLARTGMWGNESIRIFDFVAKRPSGGS
jgi:hypothetical protein